MTYDIRYAYTSHMGKIRGNNEDNFWCCGDQLPSENTGTEGILTGSVVSDDFPALAVFDGMGGESCGEMAAFLAAQAYGEYYGENRKKMKGKSREFLEESCRRMNQAVCEYCLENRIRSMGTTLALVQFSGEKLHICNLGDSRVYLSREGKFSQLSTDHVVGGRTFGKAPLTQYLGVMEEEMALEPVIEEHPLTPGIRLLLCSDGLSDMLSDGELADILARELSPEDTVQLLLERALKKGGRDNITIILCEVGNAVKQGFFGKLGACIKKYLG